MDEEALLSQLEDLAEKLGIRIRYETFHEETPPSAGGLCRLRGQYLLILNAAYPKKEKTRVLARALRRFDLSGLYLRPVLRKYLDEMD